MKKYIYSLMTCSFFVLLLLGLHFGRGGVLTDEPTLRSPASYNACMDFREACGFNGKSCCHGLTCVNNNFCAWTENAHMISENVKLHKEPKTETQDSPRKTSPIEEAPEERESESDGLDNMSYCDFNHECKSRLCHTPDEWRRELYYYGVSLRSFCLGSLKHKAKVGEICTFNSFCRSGRCIYHDGNQFYGICK